MKCNPCKDIVSASEFRHRITFQQLTETTNDIGDPVETWTDFATVWASVKPASGREKEIAAQMNAEVTHRIKIRYRAGLDPDMRIKFGTRYFRIQAILNVDEANQFMMIDALETEVDN